MKTFIYTSSLLVEKNPYASHSEEPSYYKKFLQRGCDRIPIDFYNKCVKHTLFLEYESSKETLPVSGTGWIEGQEYVEGRDFNREYQWYDIEFKLWVSDSSINESNRSEWNTRQAAVLINHIPDAGKKVSNKTEKMEDEGDESSEPIKDISKEKSIHEKPKDFKAQLTLNIIGVEDDSGGVTVWLESHPYIIEQAETKELAIEKLRDIVARELMNF